MRLLRLALIPAIAGVISCSTATEERQASQPNPVQPILGTPILFPSITTSPILAGPTPTPSPRSSPSPSPSPNPNQQPSPTPSPSATPSPSPSPSPTPSPTPSPSPSPSPTPTPNPGASGIHHIRVGFFGISCKNGKTAPSNGAGQLPVGCKGFVTATPKYANGDDVPLAVHGPDIDWDLASGAGIVEVRQPSFPSDFNKDTVGLKVGAFSLCATVKGVKGCLNGTVTP